jgi:hypothetical protein
MTGIQEHLGQELDRLSEEQLKQVADFIAFLKFREQRLTQPAGESQPATPHPHIQEAEKKSQESSQLESQDSQPVRYNNNPGYQPTGEILTIEEIRSRYPREWVLIADTETDFEWNVYRGEVLAHSAEQAEIYELLSGFKNIKSIAIEYTGPIPEDFAVML